MASRCFALGTGQPTWVDYFLYARIHPVVVGSLNGEIIDCRNCGVRRKLGNILLSFVLWIIFNIDVRLFHLRHMNVEIFSLLHSQMSWTFRRYYISILT